MTVSKVLLAACPGSYALRRYVGLCDGVSYLLSGPARPAAGDQQQSSRPSRARQHRSYTEHNGSADEEEEDHSDSGSGDNADADRDGSDLHSNASSDEQVTDGDDAAAAQGAARQPVRRRFAIPV